MTSITLSVQGADARAAVNGPLTSGMVGIPVTIEYDDAWRGLTKNLVCRCGQWGPDRGETRTIAGIGENAVVAHEVMKADMYLYLGVEGYSADGKLVIPTTWAECGRIRPGANAGADLSADPRLPVWLQLQNEITRIKSCLQENPAVPPDSTANGTGLSDPQISALNEMFRVCAYDSTKDYAGAYGEFQAAFGIGDSDAGDTEKALTGISAVYSGGPVAVGTAVAALTGILVTAHYDDGTSGPVTGYTLSGTIVEGENTVTVSYRGRTAAFTVTGVTAPGGGETAAPLGVEWTEGYTVSVSSSNIGDLSANETWVASDYVDVTGKTGIRIYNDTGKLFSFQGAFYDESKTARYTEAWYIWKQYVQGSSAYPSPLNLTIPEGAVYVRLSTTIQAGSASAGYVRYDALTYELV